MKEFLLNRTRFLDLLKKYQEIVENINLLNQKANPSIVNGDLFDPELLKAIQDHYKNLYTIQLEIDELRSDQSYNINLINTKNINEISKIT